MMLNKSSSRFVLVDTQGMEIISFPDFETFLYMKNNPECTKLGYVLTKEDFTDACLMIDTFDEDLNPDGGFEDFLYIKGELQELISFIN